MGSQIYIQIFCDKCGDVGDNAHWGQSLQIRKELKKDGWLIKNKKDICPKCQGLLRGRINKNTILLRG